MNNLNRNIAKNEKIVLKKDIFKPEYHTLDQRIVIVLSGFGMSPHTRGTALYVRFADGDEARFEGYDIDEEETNNLSL